MVNMKTLIRIVFAIFIANGIDCLGKDCDNCCNCCDCFKKEKEEEKKEEEKKGENNEENNKENNKDKKEDEKKDEENKDEKKIMEYKEIEDEGYNTAISLVNDDWYKAKKKNLVLKIFKKKDDETFPSRVNGDKISIKLEENVNSKIVDQNEKEDPLNLQGKKYAFFEIKTKDENTVYLYCSDVDSIKNTNGIFEQTTHVSISVIACDTEYVTNMRSMFFRCSSLKELDLKNFNTKKVTNMYSMFYGCSSLEKLDLNNFDTTNVMIMTYMFCECKSLEKLKFGENFNTTNVTNMSYMFALCSSLNELVCGENFNASNIKNNMDMFYDCKDLSPGTIDKILGKNE